jgi:hypothetical protein
VRRTGDNERWEERPWVRGHEDIMEMDDEGMAMLSQIFYFVKKAFFV